MPTQADLVRTVMEELGAAAAGQSISAEDNEVIVRRIDPTLAELNERLIIWIPDSDDIPDACLLPLAQILAFKCAGPFGVASDKRAELKTLNDLAEQTLRDVSRPKGARQMLVTEPGQWRRRMGGYRVV